MRALRRRTKEQTNTQGDFFFCVLFIGQGKVRLSLLSSAAERGLGCMRATTAYEHHVRSQIITKYKTYYPHKNSKSIKFMCSIQMQKLYDHEKTIIFQLTRGTLALGP